MPIFIAYARDLQVASEYMRNPSRESEFVTGPGFYEVRVEPSEPHKTTARIFRKRIRPKPSIEIGNRSIIVLTKGNVVTVIPIHTDRTIGIRLRFVIQGKIIVEPVSWNVHEGVRVGKVTRCEGDGISNGGGGCCIFLDDGVILIYDRSVSRTTFRVTERNPICRTYIGQGR